MYKYDLKIDFEYSAGGIVISNNKILVIQTDSSTSYPVWTFPKGKIEFAESLKKAAMREVLEESGWSCSGPQYICQNSYIYSYKDILILKKIFWFQLFAQKEETVEDKSVKEVRWMTYAEALSTLNYNSDIELLKILSKEHKI